MIRFLHTEYPQRYSKSVEVFYIHGTYYTYTHTHSGRIRPHIPSQRCWTPLPFVCNGNWGCLVFS